MLSVIFNYFYFNTIYIIDEILYLCVNSNFEIILSKDVVTELEWEISERNKNIKEFDWLTRFWDIVLMEEFHYCTIS